MPGLPPAAEAGGALPALPIQVNALQALCRQVFGFRLAMIVLAAPFALAGTRPGPASWLVGAAVLVTFMASYVLFRDWERFGPVLLRHPWLLGADMACGALLLVTASPGSTLAHVTICTPLLAGLITGRRGAAVFAVLQSLIVVGAHAVHDLAGAPFTALFLPGLCVLAGALGSTLRGLMLGFGAAGQALTEARARLAVAGAIEEERARLAREMHDSVAKTLHGLALAADGLAHSADRMDPVAVRGRAELVARSARRAAAESRELLSDLRRDTGPAAGAGTDLVAGLRSRTEEFARRTGAATRFRAVGTGPAPLVPYPVARQALTIAAEALDNAHRHGRPSEIAVTAGVTGDVLLISVYDDGAGLPAGTTLDGLRRSGHFGLVGMVERAASIGARLRIGRGEAAAGTEVRLELPWGGGGGGTRAAGRGDTAGSAGPLAPHRPDAPEPLPVPAPVPSPEASTAPAPEPLPVPSPEASTAPAPEPLPVPSPEASTAPAPAPLPVPSPEPESGPPPPAATAPLPALPAPPAPYRMSLLT
ncbi:histidine kinase [Streptomyces sp. CAU 1734]|uniref:histidine kinase n=1 Tax=Streptomyces sp. CAU 1734 TaxID=3140360 RepID=UPI0032606FDF